MPVPLILLAAAAVGSFLGKKGGDALKESAKKEMWQVERKQSAVKSQIAEIEAFIEASLKRGQAMQRDQIDKCIARFLLLKIPLDSLPQAPSIESEIPKEFVELQCKMRKIPNSFEAGLKKLDKESNDYEKRVRSNQMSAYGYTRSGGDPVYGILALGLSHLAAASSFSNDVAKFKAAVDKEAKEVDLRETEIKASLHQSLSELSKSLEQVMHHVDVALSKIPVNQQNAGHSAYSLAAFELMSDVCKKHPFCF